MDEKIKALSHMLIFRVSGPKNRETCSLIPRVYHQQQGDNVGGFIKFEFMEL